MLTDLRTLFGVVVAAGLLATPVALAEPMVLRVPLMRQLPTLDGVIDETEWADASRGVGLVDAGGTLVTRQAIWWIGTDGNTVYAAMRTEMPPDGTLLTRILPAQRDASELGLDDALEIWLVPQFAAGDDGIGCQFVGHPLGCIWEMKYGADDYQDRFQEDYILASTLGEQSGNVPLVLAGIFPTQEKTSAWLTRTLLAVTLVYEIKIWASYGADHELLKTVYDAVYGFGYGEPDCRVTRYWEQPPFELKKHDFILLLLEPAS